MPNVTEHEIVDCLTAAFRDAAASCDALAVKPARGPIYRRLRDELKTAENCCRQIAYYRDDARWLNIGLLMEEAHKRAGKWLRTIPRTDTSNHAHPLFIKLAENLRYGLTRAEELRTKATGHIGPVTPRPLPHTRTEGRMVQVTKGGIILPPGYPAHA